jgi:cellulose synthase/poly-beta-1,6-N-acetylglucosamine synthase-like glycosyltransferase
MSLQAMDWRFFFTLIAGVSPQGRALTMMGNNMGFRREVYDRAGGFEAVAGSVTEDHALLARMHRDPSTRSALSLEGRFKNVSLPEDSLWKAFVQRRRWARGAVRDRPLEVLPGLLALWIVHALVASILVVDPLVAVLLIWSFALVDLAVMHQGARLAGEVVRLGLWSVLRFELYLIGYTLLLPVSLLLRWKLVWKGRVYG